MKYETHFKTATYYIKIISDKGIANAKFSKDKAFL